MRGSEKRKEGILEMDFLREIRKFIGLLRKSRGYFLQ